MSKKSEFFNRPTRYNLNVSKHGHNYSAGVLPYQVQDKKAYVMLGRDHDGRWSDFGGKSELSDNNNVQETAAREFFEESLGSIVDVPRTRDLLRNPKGYTMITSKTLSGNPYYMFMLRMPMLPDTCHDRFHSTLRYLKFINERPGVMEKTDVRWISLDTLKHCVDSPDSEAALDLPLRGVFRRTLTSNRKILDEIV